jgi:streptogramin lyase
MIVKRLRKRVGIPVALMAVLALAIPAGASAADPLGEVTTFTTGVTEPWTVASGSDGNLWFVDKGTNKISRITPAGTVTSFGTLSCPAYGIAAGPDEKIWFTTNDFEGTCSKVGVIDPANPEAGVEEFSTGLQANAYLTAITAGPDGNLWFTDQGLEVGGENKVCKITTSGTISCYGTTDGMNAGGAPCSITPGSDGNVWFGDCGVPYTIGKITPAGAITEFAELAGPPKSVALGADGNVWFTGLSAEGVGKITPSGTITMYPTPAGTWLSITPGPDGNVWLENTNSFNERQKVTIKADGGTLGGTYKLKFESCETGPLAFGATAATIKTALTGLSCIGTGNANVSGTGSTSPVTRNVDFIGKFARTDVELMTCNETELTGTNKSCTVETTIQASTTKIARVTPTGEVTQFDMPAAVQFPAVEDDGLTLGPDGNFWFTAFAPKAIGKFGTEPGPTLTVNKEGTGDGTVVSNPAGIECDPTCSAEFETGQEVILTASPDADSLFVSWKGCDKEGVNGRQCKVTMTGDKTVSAKFTTAYDVSVTRKGTGLGKVSSSPGGVLCLSNCSSTSAKFKELTNVTLNAAPSKNFTFAGWSGDCEGTGPCVLSSLGEDKEVEAEFTAVPQHLLTVTKSGGGQGTVKAKQAGINCGAVCSTMSAAYYQGAVIELLVPVPGKGSTFGGWSGAGCSGTGTCMVTMSEAKSVTAEFK